MSALWQKLMHFESEQKCISALFGHLASNGFIDKMPTGLATNFLNAGLFSKTISLHPDMNTWASMDICQGFENISLPQEFHTHGISLSQGLTA